MVMAACGVVTRVGCQEGGNWTIILRWNDENARYVIVSRTLNGADSQFYSHNNFGVKP